MINELPIYFFWAAIGFIVYIMAIKTYKAFTNITEMEQEFKYVHADKRAILKEELTHVGIRLLAVVLFILSYFIFIRYVLPYSLLQAYSLGLNLSFSSIWHSIWATLLLFISFHLVVIELRLLFMRSRIIGK